MHIKSVYASCLKKTVALHNALSAESLITKSSFAKMMNTASSMQANIILKSASR